jgi:Phosphatidylserine/phosphatidylglycerophosphate/cardiolipin synthases and related enzymes
MVKLLDTSHCSAALSDLVKNAQSEIILVSPYLQISSRLFDLLKEASLRNVSITLIYRDDKLTAKELKKFDELKNKLVSINIKMSSLENLHAKCYLNDSTAVITSMNLYQYSQENNIEFGIRAQKQADPELYNEIYNEIQRIYRISQFDQSPAPEKTSSSKSKPAVSKKPTSADSKSAQKTVANAASNSNFLAMLPKLSDSKCHCIRCGTEMGENPTEPLCKKCLSSWRRYKNEEFAEKYCFSCGTEIETTYAKPICTKCYRSKVKK